MDVRENYIKEKRTINMLWANVFALLLFVAVVAAFCGPYYLIYGAEDFSIVGESTTVQTIVFFVLVAVGVVLHELIHGICWVQCVEGGWKTIKFGIMWKSLSPYCHCSEPMKVRNYRFGALAPLFVLGIFPSVIALFIGSASLLLYGILFTASAAGDIIICWILRKESPDNYVEDHPSEAGCWVYRLPNDEKKEID